RGQHSSDAPIVPRRFDARLKPRAPLSAKEREASAERHVGKGARGFSRAARGQKEREASAEGHVGKGARGFSRAARGKRSARRQPSGTRARSARLQPSGTRHRDAAGRRATQISDRPPTKGVTHPSTNRANGTRRSKTSM